MSRKYAPRNYGLKTDVYRVYEELCRRPETPYPGTPFDIEPVVLRDGPVGEISENNPFKVAVVVLGSQNQRATVYEIYDVKYSGNGSPGIERLIRPVHDDNQFLDLGRDQESREGALNPDAVDLTLAALEENSREFQRLGVHILYIVGGTAIRDAQKAGKVEGFLEEVEKRTGCKPTVLTAEQESALSIAAFLNSIHNGVYGMAKADGIIVVPSGKRTTIAAVVNGLIVPNTLKTVRAGMSTFEEEGCRSAKDVASCLNKITTTGFRLGRTTTLNQVLDRYIKERGGVPPEWTVHIGGSNGRRWATVMSETLDPEHKVFRNRWSRAEFDFFRSSEVRNAHAMIRRGRIQPLDRRERDENLRFTAWVLDWTMGGITKYVADRAKNKEGNKAEFRRTSIAFTVHPFRGGRRAGTLVAIARLVAGGFHCGPKFQCTSLPPPSGKHPGGPSKKRSSTSAGKRRRTASPRP